MKLKSRFLPAIALLGTLALGACEKVEQDSMSPALEQRTIAQVYTEANQVTAYSFSSQLIARVNHFNKKTGKPETYETFERDAEGKLLKVSTQAAMNDALLSEEVYTYTKDGQLQETTTVYYDGNKVEYSILTTYSYNQDKSLNRKSVFEGTGDEAQLKSYTTYKSMPNGNYTQEQLYAVDDKGKAKLFSTTSYAYDTNHNPLYEVVSPGTLSSHNNLISASTTVHGTGKTYTYTYTYKYDAAGYPIHKTVINPDGSSEVYTFIYRN